jgi:hypothetical protein
MMNLDDVAVLRLAKIDALGEERRLPGAPCSRILSGQRTVNLHSHGAMDGILAEVNFAEMSVAQFCADLQSGDETGHSIGSRE